MWNSKLLCPNIWVLFLSCFLFLWHVKFSVLLANSRLHLGSFFLRSCLSKAAKVNQPANFMKQSLWEATGGSATLEFPISFELKLHYSKSSLLPPDVSHKTTVCRLCRGSDRQSVTILSRWSPGLDPRSVCMRFVVYKVTLGLALLQVLNFSMSVSFRHCSILIHSICHQHWHF